MRLENNENRSSTTANRVSTNTAASNTAQTKSTTQTATVPKQMTWATVASQPAKPAKPASSTSSTLKKKGPGMPPPPMVPGKHNMDIGTWDSPKNGPVLVPPPPPPVIPVPIVEPSPLSQTKSGSGSSSNNNNNDAGFPSSKGDHQTSISQNQKSSRSTGGQSIASDSNQSSDNRPSNQSVRPPWMSHNNPPPSSKGGYSSSQQQRPNSSHQQHQGQEDRGPDGHHQESGGRYHRGESDSENFRRGGNSATHSQHPTYPPQVASPSLSNSSTSHPLLEELRDKNNYNPPEVDLDKAALARFFVIKSYSEDDIHRSIKYGVWCSTDHGNKRLDEAFREREGEGGFVYLFFSVNGSGHFCGMAQMMTPVDYKSVINVWSQNKWKGKFKVKWIYVKDVPNNQLRHIYLENNDNRSVTNSRDTQEVPNAKGQQVLRILHSFKHVTSIFDDFYHYEKKEEEEDSKKYEPHPNNPPPPPNHPPHDNHPPSGNKGVYRSGDYERNTGSGGGAFSDKGYHSNVGGGANSGPVSFRDRNLNRGGPGTGSGNYNNFENRKNYDYRGSGAGGGGSGYGDRVQRDAPSYREAGGRRGDERGEVRERDGGGRGDNRDNGGDYHNSRGFHRGSDFNRRGGGDDRNDRNDRNYNNRDRDNYNDGNNHPAGFINRGGSDSGERGRNIGGGGGFRDNFNRDRDFHSRGRGRGGGHRN